MEPHFPSVLFLLICAAVAAIAGATREGALALTLSMGESGEHL